MLKWYKVCREDELSPGNAASISLFARPFAVFNVDGTLHGLNGACSHMKANLAAGDLQERIVQCRMHGWEFDVTTGVCLTVPEMDLETYPVKVEEGAVWIGVDPDALESSEW
jgi:nitrite reductase/ring-hydroxylating ferredoxin subunit